MPDAVDTVVCASDHGWKYHPKYVEQFSDMNKVCNVASSCIYIGILLGVHYILHICRISVKKYDNDISVSKHETFSSNEVIFFLKAETDTVTYDEQVITPRAKRISPSRTSSIYILTSFLLH
jgi:hypothetical protein